jgi:hypothetical protein
LRLLGLERARHRMQAVPGSSPSLRIEVAADPGAARHPSRLDEQEADLRLVGGGRLRMRRGNERALFSFAQVPSDEDLLHPYLAPAAALAQMWAGREALHGGGFATPAGAVALFGDKLGGKSTTLAWLATRHGVPVLCDDLVVVSGGSVLPGPRCVDLRPTSLPRDLHLDGLRAVRGTDRLRVPLAPTAGASPLVATVVLRWGSSTGLAPVPPAERPQALLPQRMYHDRLPGDPVAILELTALPMMRLTRPRGEAGLRDAAAALIDYFG